MDLFVSGLCADRGTTYEFRVSAKNDVDYGERAVATIKTPDGGQLFFVRDFVVAVVRVFFQPLSTRQLLI